MDSTSFDELLRIQNNMASMLRQETETDNKIKVLTIIDSLAPGNTKVQIEHILIESAQQGLSENDTLATIDQLVADGLLIQVEPGYVRKG